MTSYADYLFVISPPESIIYEISRYKRASARIIGQFKGLDTPAHVVVAQVERQKPFYADSAVVQMERTFNAMPPVQLYIDGFRYFELLHNQYTIYANIRSTPNVEDWFERVKKVLNIRKTLVPHIAVVKNIDHEHFTALWPHFRHKQFLMPFWVKELKIAKRETFANIPKWQAYKTFGFGNMTSINSHLGQGR